MHTDLCVMVLIVKALFTKSLGCLFCQFLRMGGPGGGGGGYSGLHGISNHEF